jgi:hypothetical protein
LGSSLSCAPSYSSVLPSTCAITASQEGLGTQSLHEAPPSKAVPLNTPCCAGACSQKQQSTH